MSSFHSLSNNEDKFYTDWEESFDSFDQMNLHENLLRGIYAYGAFIMSCLTKVSIISAGD
jgi:translation initiation factor 4A